MSGDANPTPGIPERRESRNAALSLTYQLVSAAFTAGLTIFLVRRLGPDEYGVFALATGVAAIVVLLSDIGISASTARFVAAHAENPRVLAAFLRDALRLKLIAAALVSALLAALAGVIGNAYGIDGLATALRIISIAVFGQSMMFLAVAYFEATSRNEGTVLIASVESATETAVSIGLVLLGAGVTGAVAGRATGYALAGVLSVYFLVRAIRARRHEKSEARGSRVRSILGYALALTVIDGAMTLFSRLDVLVIGAYLGAGPAGLFEAPLRLTTMVAYVGNALASGFAPRLANSDGSRSDPRSFQAALRWLILFQAFATVVLVVWATPIIGLVLGSEFAESSDVLRALGPYIFLLGIAALVSIGVNYVGEAKKRIPLAIVTVVINLALDLILIPKIGIIGGAIASGVAFAIYVPAHLWILRGRVGLSLKEPLWTTIRAGVSAAMMAIPMWYFGSSSMVLSDWILGIVSGGTAFCLGLLLTREMGIAELRGHLSRVSRRL